jgi:hypothetical protein
MKRTYAGHFAVGIISLMLAVGNAAGADGGPRIAAFGPPVRYVGVHGTYSFYIVAYGNQLAYQWWHQEPDSPTGHPIPVEEGFGSNTRRLRVTDTQATRDYNGWYWCVVTDQFRGTSTTSPRGQVFVIEAPTITQQPQNQSVPRGSRVSFTVETDPHGPVRQRYQWFFNGNPMPGSIYKTLGFVAGLRRQGYYSCRVTTIGGSTFSAAAELTVQP